MANPSLQIGNDNWAIKEDNLLGYSTAGTRFLPIPITMTRASAGTRVNSSGLVETVELLGSEQVTNGDFATNINSWEQYNSVSTWDNGTIKTTSNTTVAWIRQNDILSTGNFYKIIFKAKASNISQNINIWNGAAFIDTGLSFDSINTYKEFTYYLDFTGAGGQHLILGQQVIGNGDTINFDNVSVKESTKNDLARVDYTGSTSSLLVEPQRTNLIEYSEDFTSNNWTSSYPITNNSIVSPDGTLNATKVLVGTTNGALRTTNITVSASTSYVFSFFAKRGTATEMKFRVYDFTSGQAGDIISQTSYYSSTSATEWTRIKVPFTTPSGANLVSPYMESDGQGNGDFYVWGAQLEEGSFATSYIPTIGSTVTRVRDLYSKTGIIDKINSEEGVLFAEISALADDSTSRSIALSDGTTGNRILFRYQGSNIIRGFVISGGTINANFQFNHNNINNLKFAIKWKVNDFALWVNGNKVLTDASGSVPTGLNRLALDNGSGTQEFYGKAKQLQVFKTALTDSELATLTTI